MSDWRNAGVGPNKLLVLGKIWEHKQLGKSWDTTTGSEGGIRIFGCKIDEKTARQDDEKGSCSGVNRKVKMKEGEIGRRQ